MLGRLGAAAFAAGARSCQRATSGGAGSLLFTSLQPSLALRCTNSSAKAGAAAAAAAATAGTGTGFGLLALAQQYPFAFQVGVSTIKTSLADLMTQTAIEGKSTSEIDWKRNGVFIVFGAVYLGGFQWWLQVTQFRKWFPGMDRFANASMAEKLKDVPGMLTAGKQVLFDIFIHLPLMYFPAFYTVKEFVQGKSYNPIDWVKNGVTKYYNNFQKDCTAMVQLWAPADVILFSLPMWLRMPCRHLVSLGWTSYLSFLRGSSIPTPSALAAAE